MQKFEDRKQIVAAYIWKSEQRVTAEKHDRTCSVYGNVLKLNVVMAA